MLNRLTGQLCLRIYTTVWVSRTYSHHQETYQISFQRRFFFKSRIHVDVDYVAFSTRHIVLLTVIVLSLLKTRIKNTLFG